MGKQLCKARLLGYLVDVWGSTMNDLIIYGNDFNKLDLGELSKVSMNLLMALCSKLKDQGGRHIIIEFDELKVLAAYKHNGNHPEDFPLALETMIDQLLKVNSKILIRKPSGKRIIYRFDLFPTFIISEEDQTLEVAVNIDFQFLLNDLKDYTSLERKEFMALRSKYSKTLYRLLRQWKSVGRLTVGDGGQEYSIESFKRKMGMPDSYTTRDISKCVDKAVDEINKLNNGKGSIRNLRCEKVYAKQRGKPLCKLIFTFVKVEKNNAIQGDIAEDPIYQVVKETLNIKKELRFSDEDVMAVFRAAKKNSLDLMEVKRRIYCGLLKKPEEIKKSRTGYIISLMSNFNPPVQKIGMNNFNEFEQNKYDFDNLEKELIDNHVEESDSEETGPKNKE